MIRFRWLDLKKTDHLSKYWGWQLWGYKGNGIRGPRTYTLDIFLGSRILVVKFGKRY